MVGQQGPERSKRTNRQSPKPPKKATARQRTTRSDDRTAKVAAGLVELEIWLRDLIYQGLAAIQTQPSRYWDNMAARMVDAQAPGVARRLRDMSSVVLSGEGWTERLLSQLGSLYLLADSFKRIDSLSPSLQADVALPLVGHTRNEMCCLKRGSGTRGLCWGR